METLGVGFNPSETTGDENIVRLSVVQARRLIFGALTGAGTTPDNARYLTEAILDTEQSGLEGHGFYWLQYYCDHVRSGKVNGKAVPKVTRLSPVAFKVDVRKGFAHPAIEKGFAMLIPAARKHGIAGLAVHASYNAATLGFHTGYLAKRGLLAFGFTNAMPAMAPVGGRKAVLGTNPMSFAVPGRAEKIAVLVDQSASAVTWTAVKRAAEQGLPIPLGWALDRDGKPTTIAAEGLQGSIAASGGAKGFNMGLMGEIMCAALTGSLRGPEMGSFTENDGKAIGCGQFFIAIEPQLFSGGHFARIVKAITTSITAQDGARLPNARREANIKRSRTDGLTLSASLHARLKDYCQT
jgi:(2R)-3-sulfolactate dehydrogenase (NADP+)